MLAFFLRIVIQIPAFPQNLPGEISSSCVDRQRSDRGRNGSDGDRRKYDDQHHHCDALRVDQAATSQKRSSSSSSSSSSGGGGGGALSAVQTALVQATKKIKKGGKNADDSDDSDNSELRAYYGGK